MKQVVLSIAVWVLMLAAVMVLLLSGRQVRDIPLADIDEALTGEFSLDGMEKAGDMRMKRAFGLNASDYSEYLYYTPDNTMSVNEILIIRCKDASQIPEIEAGIDRRLSVQKQNFDGYGTDQTDLLNHAAVYKAGSYVVFIVSREADAELALVRGMIEGRDR